MATSATPRRNENERKGVATQYHERNRTFSSTTTNHYKNKLAQIGIQKDLREILERKKLEKEQEKTVAPHTDPINEASQTSRKVRFSDDRVAIRRSKSFTAGTGTNFVNNTQKADDTPKERSPPKKFNKNFKGKKNDYFDLKKPTNIKIELQTGSGERKCILDENVSLSAVKCDLKNCRNILSHSENKNVLQETVMDKNKDKYKSHSFLRGGEKSKSFNKKNKASSENGSPKEAPGNTTIKQPEI